MNVLSLFDGMSCGQIALNRAGIKYNNYYASEIDKYAIKVTKANYPDTKHIGSIVDVKSEDLSKIDLLIGGSPCQGFSFAGKQLNFEDPRSKLFFEYVRLLKECKPKYFLLENVDMKQEYLNVISKYLGVSPVKINSNLVSAQNRERWYWTNIPGDEKTLFENRISQPKDKRIFLKDIIHEKIDRTCLVKKSGKELVRTNNLKSPTLMARDYKGFGNHQASQEIMFDLKEYIVPFDKTLQILDKEVESGKVGYFRKDSQANRVYYIHNKAVTLCGDAGGGAAKMGQYLFGCITPSRLEKRQNGQRFSSGKKFYTLTAQDKHGILIEGYIRKLTPVECCRLQTVPDGYTSHVSNSQQYKMIGNGWTVDVICHILKGLS